VPTNAATGARLVVVRLGDHGGDVERLCADQEVSAGDGRDHCDLVAVAQLVRPLGVRAA